MELTIKTLKGACVLSNVQDAITVEQLKHMLFEQHKDDFQLPHPEQQRLVYKQEVLPAHAALQHLGIGHGDQLVMLESKKLLRPSTPRVTPAPDAAAIRAAITEEARRRGLEHTLREERPPAAASARRNMLITPEMLGSVDADLLQLLEQALSGSGQLQGLLGGLRLSSSGDGSGQHDDEEEEEDDGAEIQAPEPAAAHIAQLTDMGFTEPLARKALQLTRSQVELALEWLLQHSEEPGAADPPTQEQLRQVYGRPRRRRRQQQAPAPAAAAGPGAGSGSSAAAMAASAHAAAAAAGPMAAVLSQLTEMGFDADAAQQALSRVGPNLDIAVSLLLGQGLPAAVSSTGATSSDGGGSSGSGAAAPAAAGQAGSVSGGSVAAGQSAGAGARGGGVQHDVGLSVDEDEEEDEMEDAEDEEQYDEYEDEEEDEYVDYEDAEDDGVGPALALPLEQALGTMGSMDLHEFGSADMEQLLQGVAIQELYGNQLLMSGGMEGGMGGMGGPQGSLLRLMEAPGLLQQMMAAVQQPSPPPEGQQQQHDTLEEESVEQVQAAQQQQQPPREGSSES